MIPSWILDIFAAIMLVVAAVSAARLVAARPWQHGKRPAALADIDVAHLLMGIAMAGTLVSGLRILPDGAWEVVFGVLTAWFAYRVARDARVSGFRALAGGHCAPHLVHAGAMLYMFVAVSAPAAHGSGGMGGMGGGVGGMGTLGLPFLALLFTLVLVGYCIWDLDQVSGPGTSGHYSLAVARPACGSPPH
jgi:opacity protein-like surface antigen